MRHALNKAAHIRLKKHNHQREFTNLEPKTTMHTLSPSADMVSAKTDSISAKYFCSQQEFIRLDIK